MPGSDVARWSPRSTALGLSRHAEAAPTTIPGSIDPNETQGESTRTVERRLRPRTGGGARAIIRASGGFRSKQVETPRDAAGRWWGRATIRRSKPSGPNDTTMIEIDFEKPAAGNAERACAFRGIVQTDGVEACTRFASDFETTWPARFPK